MAVTAQDWDFAFLPGPNASKPGWEETIRKAYLVEHGAKENQEIAALMGRSSGRVSHYFKDAVSSFDRQTIDTILAPLTDENHRQEIVRVWEMAVMAASEREGREPWQRRMTADADRMNRENRPDLALETIWGVMPLVSPPDVRRTYIRSILIAAFRLDRLGEAMEAASFLYRWGKHSDNPYDMAGGLAMKARAMRRSDRFPMEEIAATLTEAMDLVRLTEESPGNQSQVIIASRDMIESEEIGNLLRHHELFGGQEGLVRKLLPLAEKRAASAASPQQKVLAAVLESWMRLSLEEYARAEDVLDEAFENAGPAIHKVTQCGLMKAKILAARGETAKAEEYLFRLAEICIENRYLYLHRLAQQEMAALMAGSFKNLRTWRNQRSEDDFL